MIYTYGRGDKQHGSEHSNQFGSGWNKEGHDWFRNLIWELNELRAHFNQSFDKRMKMYAKRMRNKERNKKACKQAKKVTKLPNDMMLPSAEEILRQRADTRQVRLNEELMHHVDEYSDDDDDDIDAE